MIAAVQALPDVLSQYSYLADLRNTKGGVFFAALQQQPELLLPIVYTPGVGDACLNWGLLSARPRALVLRYEDKGSLARKLREFKSDASAVVVTDGIFHCCFSASMLLHGRSSVFSTGSAARKVVCNWQSTSGRGAWCMARVVK